MSFPPCHLFVTGTDTGVGKTRIAVRLIQTLRAQHVRAAGFKPILCGEDRNDAEALWRASGELDLDEVNPVWLKTPAAPLSAKLAGEETGLDAAGIQKILDRYEALKDQFDIVITEGAGGWEAPLNERETTAGLARMLGAPVLVVAANRLGVLNHTRLTVDAIRRDALPVAGVFLNEIAPPDPADVARRTNLEALRLMLPGIPVEPAGWEESGPFSPGLIEKLVAPG